MVNAMNGGVDGDDVILKTDDEHLNMSPSAIGYTAAANKVIRCIYFRLCLIR